MPKPMIRDPRHPTWNAHNPIVKEMFCLPKKLPQNTELVELGKVDGIYCALLPVRNDGRRKHRLVGICPNCRKTLSLGRFHQHECGAT